MKPGLAVFDFDGTLLGSGGRFHPRDLEALGRIGDLGVVRVLATGRSPFSLSRTLAGRRLPVDYVIFSSGGGVMRFADGAILLRHTLSAEQVDRAAAVLAEEDLDFMIHRPAPENHRFAWHDTGRENPDFHRRLSLYREYCEPLGEGEGGFGPAAQLLAVVPRERARAAIERLERRLPDFSLIRATSPIDGRSVWVEIFPPGVTKAGTAAWLAERLGADPAQALAVGNDTNDLDLLTWAGTACVVANGHPDLRARFPTVAGHDEGGVAEAIDLWLSRRA